VTPRASARNEQVAIEAAAQALAADPHLKRDYKDAFKLD
jgi:hypothetical protein